MANNQGLTDMFEDLGKNLHRKSIKLRGRRDDSGFHVGEFASVGWMLMVLVAVWAVVDGERGR